MLEKNQNSLQLEGGRVTADGRGFFLIALGKKAPFLAAVSTEEEKAFQALISALRDEGRINLNITQ